VNETRNFSVTLPSFQPLLEHFGIAVAAVTGVLLIIGLRLAGIRWRLSLPVFESRASAPSGENKDFTR